MAKKWIAGAIENEGALRRHFGVKEGETIPAGKLDALISELQAKSKGDKKLSDAELTLLRQALLAKRMRGFSKSRKKG
jgi:hypothetical protein